MEANNETTDGGVTSQKLHFVIVGGSLGGLAAGIALKALGHDTTILERNTAPVLQDQGAGIVAGSYTLDFLKKYNRCQRTEVAVRSDSRQYLDREGNVVHSVDAEQYMTSWDLTYNLLRANYDGLSSPYCDAPPPDPSHGTAVYLHDHTVTDVAEHGNDGVRVSWHSTSDPSRTGTLHADRLIGADGPSSLVRSLFAPSAERTYAGYCALRGTVPEHETNPATLALLANRFTFFHAPGLQILTYLIPGRHGTCEPGQRLLNFVYYTNFPASSSPDSELDQILTDAHGRRHRTTVPPGLIHLTTWARQREIAREKLPPPLAEVVCKAARPFVQAVTDVISPRNEFLGGRVVLVGDALACFRPHTVASTAQAAMDAMVYAEYVAGRVGRGEWVWRTMGYARFVQRRGVEMGERSQLCGGLGLGEYVRDRDEASGVVGEGVMREWAERV